MFTVDLDLTVKKYNKPRTNANNEDERVEACIAEVRQDLTSLVSVKQNSDRGCVVDCDHLFARHPPELMADTDVSLHPSRSFFLDISKHPADSLREHTMNPDLKGNQ